MNILEILITLLLFVIIIIPLGNYIYKVTTFQKTFLDKMMNKFENFIYKLIGTNNEQMNMKEYTFAFVITNLIQAIIVFIALKLQGISFLNPNKITGMKSSLSFNTAVSFITNTNFQNYIGEKNLSYFSQMIGIIFLMFTSAASGLAIYQAFTRAITGRKGKNNFFVDFLRSITRILIPLSIVVSIIFMWQGVPQSFKGNITVKTIEGKFQTIALGPVASMESIKHIGTNGGGFFGANSAHPFENPTPLTNIIEIISMMIIPGSLIVSYGHMVKNKKQGIVLFTSVFILLLIALGVCYTSEKNGNAAFAKMGINQTYGNMEGKEVRFGITGSTLFTTITTAFTTGTVNNMHDSLTPLGGMTAMWQMMLNCVFGGDGVGFINIIMYSILAVFLSGLMVGRTPEFLGKKIESKEIKYIAIAILIHPFIILVPTMITLLTKSGTNAISNPSFHGLSQILYAYTSSAANNGSAFAGLKTNTLFWNLSTGLVMIIGRYTSIILMMGVASSLSKKKAVPEGPSTFKTDSSQFVLVLISVIVIIGALTFLPALALGPIAEHLTLGY